MKQPIFITGNQNKADYLSRLLGVELKHQKIDLDEIQSTSLEEIVEHKVRQAYELIKKPVLVEDVSLKFKALGDLPGPFIKFFIEAPDGLSNLCRMLDAFETRSARAECTYGYFDGKDIQLFHSGMNGAITTSPKGDGGFGWDAVFCPEGYNGKTRAELSKNDYEIVYQCIKPIAALKDFLKSQ